MRGQVGSQANPVTNVALHDLTVSHADITYLLPYETPSGGGYSVHRGGAIHIEGAVNPSVTEVIVDSPGGNGLLLSNYVRGAVIARSEFKWVGDSAIVMLGSTMDTQPCNGTNGDQPRGTQIVGCFIHEVGIWGKQGAGIFQALTSDTNISHTVIFVSAMLLIIITFASTICGSADSADLRFPSLIGLVGVTAMTFLSTLQWHFSVSVELLFADLRMVRVRACSGTTAWEVATTWSTHSCSTSSEKQQIMALSTAGM